jgi:ArsR family transcriptional regulator
MLSFPPECAILMLDSMRRFKAGIFQALAHPTRIAIVEFLQYGEMTVNQLCEKVNVEQANASQHLAVLRNRNIVQTRKEGNQIFYSLRDPLLAKVLQIMREFFLAHMNEALEMLREEQKESATPREPAAKKKKQEARR